MRHKATFKVTHAPSDNFNPLEPTRHKDVIGVFISTSLLISSNFSPVYALYTSPRD